ncbi:MAG: hypothetical protein Q4B07_08075 [Clostridia bacterium]|nr:hypothetical protein [Clostridia bacterium]
MIEAILNNHSLRVKYRQRRDVLLERGVEAVVDALDLSFTNPNKSANRHGKH